MMRFNSPGRLGSPVQRRSELADGRPNTKDHLSRERGGAYDGEPTADTVKLD